MLCRRKQLHKLSDKMNSNIQRWIQLLEAEWSKSDGFLGLAREGQFDPKDGDKFTEKLKAIKLSDDNILDRRFVSLLWYIPLFLSWQRERVAENGGDVVSFEKIKNEVQAIVEDILGVP